MADEDQHHRVVVVVPCRDAAAFVPELLESLAAQTLAPSEILIVDDGSRDASADIVERWAAEHPSVPLALLRQPPLGVAAAVRAAIAASDSPLIARADADDRVHPMWLELLAQALDAHPEAGYAYPAMRMFGAVEGRYYTREFDAASLVIEGNFVSSGSLMQRDRYDQTSGIADLPAWEDWDLWLSFLEAGFPGVLVDAELYYWRRHGKTRNRLTWWQRRRLRARIWWRHRALVRSHFAVALLVRRWRHPIRQQ